MTKVYGVVSNDKMAKKRILQSLQQQGLECANIHSDSFFDNGDFQALIVDFDSPFAELVIKSAPDKCLVYHQEGGKENRAKIRKLGCQKVFGSGYFFSTILPNIKDV